ncbi:MAG: 30S ribosomal protein S20 [Opitutales bacterium]|nr:30S ribosomal protein S20 [Opitutales bacterium]
MPNIRSAKKRVKLIARRTASNKIMKSKIKSHIKEFYKIIESGNKEEAHQALRQAIKTIDKAAKKGHLHKNNAARKKSLLQKKFNLLAS